MKPRARDSRGRFVKAKPKAPLDPGLVKSLGQHRRAVEWADSYTAIEIITSWQYRNEPNTDTAQAERSQTKTEGKV